MNFDFSGINPWNPLSSPAPEPGPYKAKISDVDPAYNGGKSTKFVLDLANGQTTDIYIGNEPGEKGGNKRKWKQALIAVATAAGKAEAEVVAMLNRAIDFDPVATFKGKDIHVLVIAVPGQDAEGRPNLPNKEFLTASQYAQSVAAAGAGHKPASTANGPAPTGAAPAAGGDVLGKLFG